MSVNTEAYLLLGTDPENVAIDDEILMDLKDEHNYGEHGNYFIGETWYVGLKIPTSDILEQDWYETYRKLRKEVAEKLGCSEDLVELSNGTLTF